MTSPHRRTFPPAAVFGTALALSMPVHPAAAATFQTLHAFGGSDGFASQTPLVADASGNLYGTAAEGGSSNRGVVFELSPPGTSGGAWTYTVIHNFGGATDGADILGGLAFNAFGTLFGTSYMGGTADQGMIYALVPPKTEGAAWTQPRLFNFGPSNLTGYWPASGLVFRSGKFYGTASYGGSNEGGLVFALVPPTGTGQPWTESVLYDFQAYGSGDGYSPQAGLAFDSKDNIYGTTISGGANSNGAVFELSPVTGGGWTETVIYSFGEQANDGSLPHGPLLPGAGGVLYGTTSQGGTAGAGTVFELVPGSGGWTEKILYSFANNNIDGIGPQGPLAIDSTGRIYGATPFGGTKAFGTIFRLTPGTTLPWTETVVHNFSAGTDGSTPYSGVYLGANGTIYGTTSAGGAGPDQRWGYGTVYAYTP
ncbi:MAG TPA: choice-of-anchor tandem repeat GloVer-containing protein, partial [Stellaceae bacterium]|nr:choice-of-anchor tandem repeat GloVer-containing protein [Stellaceae bacterium]